MPEKPKVLTPSHQPSTGGSATQLLLLSLAIFLPLTGHSNVLTIEPRAQAQSPLKKSEPDPPVDQLLTFKVLKIGNGQRKDGIWTQIVTIESSRGELIYKTTVQFGSEALAKQELENQSRQALEIERLTPQTDKDGKVIGQRVLARFSPNDEICKPSCLFYTKGVMYYQIESDSRDALLAYEHFLIKRSSY